MYPVNHPSRIPDQREPGRIIFEISSTTTKGGYYVTTSVSSDTDSVGFCS